MADQPDLQIPMSFLSTLEAFTSLNEPARNRLKEVFTATYEFEARVTLVDSIQQAVETWSRETSSIFLEFLISLYDLDQVLDVADLTTVASMVARSESLDLQGDERTALAADLAEILRSDRVNLVARAQDLSLEYERVLDEVRLITDIRPIFTPGKTDQLDGAIVSHSLRLRYKGRDGPDRYVSLDRSRLLSLQRQVNRAVEKQKRLEVLLRDVALPFVEPDDPGDV